MNKNQKVYANKNLICVRLAKALSLRDLAESSGVTASTLCKIENGRPVLPSTARKICTALNCTFEEIFFIGGYENEKTNGNNR